MVNNTIDEQEEGWRIQVLEEIKKYPRGISITGIVNNCEISRTRVRTALAYLRGAGKIGEDRASMAKLYYII